MELQMIYFQYVELSFLLNAHNKGIERCWQTTSPFMYLSVEVEHLLPYLAIFARMPSQTLGFPSPKPLGWFCQE
jgi:hypothetical protein